MKNILFVCVLIFHQFSLRAQEISLNHHKAFTFSANQESKFLGSTVNKHYFLVGTQNYSSGRYGKYIETSRIQLSKDKLYLVELNTDFSLSKEIPFTFLDELSDLVEAYVENEQLHFIFINKKEKLVKVSTDYSLNEMQRYSMDLVGIRDKKSSINANQTQVYFSELSDTKELLALGINNQIFVLNVKLEEVSKQELDPGIIDIRNFQFTEKGDLYFLSYPLRENFTVSINYYNKDSNQLTQKLIPQHSKYHWSHGITRDPVSGKIFLTTLSGTDFNLNRQNVLVSENATGLNLWKFSQDLNEIELFESYNLESYGRKTGKKAGIEDAYVQAPLILDDGVLIAIKVIDYVSTENSSYRNFKNIQLFKIEDSAIAFHKVLETNIRFYYFDFDGTTVWMKKNTDKINLLYYGENRGKILNSLEIQSNLNEVAQKEYKLDNDANPNLRNSIKIADGIRFVGSDDELLGILDVKY